MNFSDFTEDAMRESIPRDLNVHSGYDEFIVTYDLIMPGKFFGIEENNSKNPAVVIKVTVHLAEHRIEMNFVSDIEPYKSMSPLETDDKETFCRIWKPIGEYIHGVADYQRSRTDK